MKKSLVKKILKQQREIEKFGEDKLNALLWRGIAENFVDKAIDFARYLIRTKQDKAYRRFKKVIEVINKEL